MKKISEKYLAQLKMQQSVRDSAAYAFGSASVEFEIEKAKLVMLKGNDKTLRYGALCFELDGHRERCMKIVARSMKEQKKIGDAAMRESGIDPDPATFTIDLATGVVQQLVGADWVEA